MAQEGFDPQDEHASNNQSVPNKNPLHITHRNNGEKNSVQNDKSDISFLSESSKKQHNPSMGCSQPIENMLIDFSHCIDADFGENERMELDQIVDSASSQSLDKNILDHSHITSSVIQNTSNSESLFLASNPLDNNNSNDFEERTNIKSKENQDETSLEKGKNNKSPPSSNIENNEQYPQIAKSNSSNSRESSSSNPSNNSSNPIHPQTQEKSSPNQKLDGYIDPSSAIAKRQPKTYLDVEGKPFDADTQRTLRDANISQYTPKEWRNFKARHPDVKGIIYRITDLTNGKNYIGETVRYPSKRFGEHNSDREREISNMKIAKVIELHGVNNFSQEIIDIAKSTTEMKQKQDQWILKENVYDPKIGYNSHKTHHVHVPSGEEHPMYGKHHTDESKEKNRKSHLGVPLSEKHRSNLSIAHKGNKPSEATRQKTSKTLKGKPKPPRTQEHSNNIREAKKGVKPSNETRQSMKVSQNNRRKEEISKPFTRIVQPDGRVTIGKNKFSMGIQNAGKELTIDPSKSGFYTFLDGKNVIKILPIDPNQRHEIAHQSQVKDPTVCKSIHFDPRGTARFCGTYQSWGKGWAGINAKGWKDGEDFHVVFEGKDFRKPYHYKKNDKKH